MGIWFPNALYIFLVVCPTNSDEKILIYTSYSWWKQNNRTLFALVVLSLSNNFQHNKQSNPDTNHTSPTPTLFVCWSLWCFAGNQPTIDVCNNAVFTRFRFIRWGWGYLVSCEMYILWTVCQRYENIKKNEPRKRQCATSDFG